MSRTCQLMLASLLVIALTFAASVQADDGATSRLATYDTSTGDSFFALSLQPVADVSVEHSVDVAVLFDTSASQTGLFREDALTSLKSMLSVMDDDDRVKLFAVDLDAVALTNDFVGVRSEALTAGLEKLETRVPLGSTNMAGALHSAAESFSAESTRLRSVIYIGDGLSHANIVQTAELEQLVNRLFEQRVAISSYAIGPRRDIEFLAVLANQTGGMVLVDSNEEGSAQQAGVAMSEYAHGVVFWPTETQLPESLQEVQPQRVPPLRFDRDTILIGKLADRERTQVGMTTEVRGKKYDLHWDVDVELASDDFGFLPELLSMGRESAGLRLPTVGSAGLQLIAQTFVKEAAELVEVGTSALSGGDLENANKVADAILKRDPGNPQALAIKRAIEKQQNDEELTIRYQGGDDQASGFRDADDGAFLDLVENENEVLEDFVISQVEIGIKGARKTMATEADQAKRELMFLLETVERSPEISAETRARLRQKIESAAREASRRASEIEDQRQLAQEQEAGAQEAERLLEELQRKRVKITNLMAKFNALMSEGDFATAQNEIAIPVQELDPRSTTAMTAVHSSRHTFHVREMARLRELRHKMFAETLYQVDLAHIPFPDEPPVVYPDPEVWEDLTLRRKKYASIDLLNQGGVKERQILAALDESTILEFDDSTLDEVVEFLAEFHQIPMIVDRRALDDIGFDFSLKISKELRGISLRSGLRLLLKEMDLTYVISDEVLQITTPEEAESQLITKVYPVGDLVVPIMSGGGGMMGGGGGGGGGMMGGGMGGGGGGMMGGGGGGLGGGGGGGGGMFAVDEDLKIGKPKSRKKITLEPLEAKKPARPVIKRTVRNVHPIELTLDDGQSKAEAWDYFFETNVTNDEQALRKLSDQVHRTVQVLMKRAQRKISTDGESSASAQEHINEIVTIIRASLRRGFAQPWMYEALALSMGMNEAPDVDVERALMSAVDFGGSHEDILHAAMYMARMGFDRRALDLFQDISVERPVWPEPYVNGLAAAKRLEDIEGIKWACVGVLSQAWPREHRRVYENALRTAKVTLNQLRQENRDEEAEAFTTALNQSLVRDCFVKVTWTGDADIDILVEEPAGTVCSFQNARTIAGGVLLGDSFSRPGQASSHGTSEVYVCPQAFAGEYRMLLRRVWGKVAAGKVTVDVYTNYRGENETRVRRQIPLSERDAVVIFEIDEGRRMDALDDVAVETVTRKHAVNRTMLAQQLKHLEHSSASQSYLAGNAKQNGKASRNGAPGGLNAAKGDPGGFFPIVTLIPEGTFAFVTAVVSADRRYVRITPMPFFTGIGEVFTYNINSGEQVKVDDDDDDDG